MVVPAVATSSLLNWGELGRLNGVQLPLHVGVACDHRARRWLKGIATPQHPNVLAVQHLQYFYSTHKIKQIIKEANLAITPMQDRDYIITTHSIQTNCAAPSTLTGPPASGVSIAPERQIDVPLPSTLTGPPASGISIEGPTCVTRRKTNGLERWYNHNTIWRFSGESLM